MGIDNFGYVEDLATDSYYGQGKTIFGQAKWFDPTPKNRVKLILDCDEHTLEFRLLNEEDSFWKIALSEDTKNLLHYPLVMLSKCDCEDLTATFCLDLSK